MIISTIHGIITPIDITITEIHSRITMHIMIIIHIITTTIVTIHVSCTTLGLLTAPLYIRITTCVLTVHVIIVTMRVTIATIHRVITIRTRMPTVRNNNYAQ